MEIRSKPCEVADYLATLGQHTNVLESLKGNDHVNSGVVCPDGCDSILKIDDGLFPKSTMECPENGITVRLGRLATFIRSKTV